MSYVGNSKIVIICTNFSIALEESDQTLLKLFTKGTKYYKFEVEH